MTVLLPGELSSLRAAFTRLYDAEATVMRRVQVSDSAGGFTDSYVAAGTYPCTFSKYPVRPLDREQSERVQVMQAWQFVFPSGTDIQNTDKLIVGSRTFEVVAAGAWSTDITLGVYAEEIM